jgi:hypothetical protein
MAKTIYVEVKIQIEDNADAYDVIADCDYSFTEDSIISYEIVAVTDSN